MSPQIVHFWPCGWLINQTESCFYWKCKNVESFVWWVGLGVGYVRVSEGRIYNLYSIIIIMSMEIPHKTCVGVPPYSVDKFVLRSELNLTESLKSSFWVLIYKNCVKNKVCVYFSMCFLFTSVNSQKHNISDL